MEDGAEKKEKRAIFAVSLFARFSNCSVLSEQGSISLVSITANVTSRFLARGGQVFVSTTAATSDGRTPEGGRVVLYVSAVWPWQNPTDRVNEL